MATFSDVVNQALEVAAKYTATPTPKGEVEELQEKTEALSLSSSFQTHLLEWVKAGELSAELPLPEVDVAPTRNGEGATVCMVTIKNKQSPQDIFLDVEDLRKIPLVMFSCTVTRFDDLGPTYWRARKTPPLLVIPKNRTFHLTLRTRVNPETKAVAIVQDPEVPLRQVELELREDQLLMDDYTARLLDGLDVAYAKPVEGRTAIHGVTFFESEEEAERRKADRLQILQELQKHYVTMREEKAEKEKKVSIKKEEEP